MESAVPSARELVERYLYLLIAVVLVTAGLLAWQESLEAAVGLAVVMLSVLGGASLLLGLRLRRALLDFEREMPGPSTASTDGAGVCRMRWPDLDVEVYARTGLRRSRFEVSAGDETYSTSFSRTSAAAREALGRVGEPPASTGAWDGGVPRGTGARTAGWSLVPGVAAGGLTAAAGFEQQAVPVAAAVAVAFFVVAIWSHEKLRSAVGDVLDEWVDAGVRLTAVDVDPSGARTRWLASTPERTLVVEGVAVGPVLDLQVVVDGERHDVSDDTVRQDARRIAETVVGPASSG